MTDEIQDIPEDTELTDLDSAQDVGERTLRHGVLSPRLRRFCQLVAEGKDGQMIKAELGYADSRISALKRNVHVAAEITRLQDKIFEETIGKRLKDFVEPALANIQSILTDRTNRVKVSEKMALSQWIVEKLDGKAASKIDVGENLLAVFMDKLDAKKTAPRQTHVQEIDVTPQLPAEPTAHPDQPATPAQPVDDDMATWIAEFASSPRSGE